MGLPRLGLPLLGLGLLVAACTRAEPNPAPSTEAVQSRSPVVFPDTWRFSADDAPVTAEHAVVVTTDSVASGIGAGIMERGGNAVDAAVAVSFVLAVVNPQAGNIGGGGFMVVRMADGTAAALDYREKAPLATTRDMFLDADGNVSDKSMVGHLAAGVPGSVMGMWEAHRRFGTLPWAELVEPAALLADGFEVYPRFQPKHHGFPSRPPSLRSDRGHLSSGGSDRGARGDVPSARAGGHVATNPGPGHRGILRRRNG